MEEFPVLRCRVIALFALGDLDLAFAHLSVLVYGCCLWSTAYVFSGRYLVQQWIHVYKWLWTNFSIFYVAVNFNPEAFVLHSV